MYLRDSLCGIQHGIRENRRKNPIIQMDGDIRKANRHRSQLRQLEQNAKWPGKDNPLLLAERSTRH